MAGALVVVVVLGVVFVAYRLRHRASPQPQPVSTVVAPPIPSAVPAGPSNVIVLDRTILAGMLNSNPGELITLRALQGLVNRPGPRIFILVDLSGGHDQDWLNLLSQRYGATLTTKPDGSQHIDQLSWYLTRYRSDLAGYIVFDGSTRKSGGPSSNVALSLAGILDAIPIDRGDTNLLEAAKAAGLKQLADVSTRDYGWLKSSQYWSQFNRAGIYLNNPSGISPAADYAVTMKMAVFWDDVRSDPDMRTMATMLSDQDVGGMMYGWGYTDDQHREDIFVRQASRYNQSVMDLPSNLSVYMHYPYKQLANSAPPALPTDLSKHYVAFVYSDGDNPRVLFDDLTEMGNDRYSSQYRGRIPIGWTVPPEMPDFAAPVITAIYNAATPDDVFVAGPSGLGYAFPSLIPQKQVFAAATQRTMARLDLHSAVILDDSGPSGFTHSALDPLTAEPNVGALFFTAFNGRDQPGPAQVMWSNGKPVLPTVTVYRPPGQGNKPIAAGVAQQLNAAPRDGGVAADYTLVYLDFWSVSMTDVADIVAGLDPHVTVVRPDVLAAMVTANARH